MHITVVILQDDGYGMTRWKQANMGFTDYGLDYGNPDLVKYAEAYRAQGHRVESADALLPLLDHCISNPGVLVVDCPVDYSENDRILDNELRALSFVV